MGVDRYSRFVAVSKVALPLVALVLLSTLFLLSRNADPVSTIPFADSDLKQRLAEQVVTGPVFTGLNASGDEMVVVAESMRTIAEEEQSATELNVEFQLIDGTQVALTAADGKINMLDRTAKLYGDVFFQSSRGTTFATDELLARLEPLEVFSPGPVAGRSPFGSLDAGSMRLETDAETDRRSLVFSGGVRVVYQPKPTSQ